MIVESLKREFVINSITLPDPDITMSIDQVRKFYSTQYPEIVTATYETQINDGTAKYTFKQSVGKFG
jgi:PRTRC genetic system protein C